MPPHPRRVAHDGRAAVPMVLEVRMRTMSGWVVRDRVLTERNGNGVWARARTRVGAEMLAAKIAASRYRGTRPHSWQHVDHYTVPARRDLVVVPAEAKR